jgi:hypothetical protein
LQKTARQFPTDYFAAALVLGIAIGFAILYLGTVSSLFLAKLVCLLVSMILIFYFSHPLAHYLVGIAYGVKTMYFFVGKSDFRKLRGPLGRLSGLMPTIGTKFDSSKAAGIGKTRRGFLFGSGAIVSNVLMLVPLVIAFVFSFSLIALALGTLLFLATLVSELLFSTKIGDLYKMKKALSTG